jgi:pimeloyl-ACP methyl ester carboxylesterase
MDVYAADVLELMVHLEMPSAVVAGLSMGGYVALALARRAPERLDGLVLADTRATADSADGRAARDRMLQILDRDGPAGIAREMLPKLTGATSQRDQPDLQDAIRQIIVGHAPAGLAAAIGAMKTRPDSTPALPAIACPTTIVCGVEDAITPPAEAEAMQRAIPGARLSLLPAAGHLSNLENATAFTAALVAGR